MIPDMIDVIYEVRNSKNWDFRHKEVLCEYTDACVKALYEANNNFRHLSKDASQTHCVDTQGRRHSRDVAAWYPTGQTVDFILSAGFGDPPPGNDVVWGVNLNDAYAKEQMYIPGDPVVVVPPVEPPPTPPGPVDLTTRVAQLEAKVEDLFKLHEELTRQIKKINDQAAELTRIIHQPMVAEGSTNRELYHAHTGTFMVRRLGPSTTFAPGLTGPTGATGPPGPIGPTGETGPQGEKGEAP